MNSSTINETGLLDANVSLGDKIGNIDSSGYCFVRMQTGPVFLEGDTSTNFDPEPCITSEYTYAPLSSPSVEPSFEPSYEPTNRPSASPTTLHPTGETSVPSNEPTDHPIGTASPTFVCKIRRSDMYMIILYN